MADNRRVCDKDAEDWDSSALGLFNKMADVIKLSSPDSEDSHWRKFVSHEEEIILFYLLDCSDEVPQVARSVRIQRAPADTVYPGAKLLAHVFTGYQAVLSEVLESIPFENPIREMSDIVKILDLVGVFENNGFVAEEGEQQRVKHFQPDSSPELEEGIPNWMQQMSEDVTGHRHMDATAAVRNETSGVDDTAVIPSCRSISAGINVSSENSAPVLSLALSPSDRKFHIRRNHDSDVAIASRNCGYTSTLGQNGVSDVQIKRRRSESVDQTTNADACTVPNDFSANMNNSLQLDSALFSFAGLTIFCRGSFRKAVEKFLVAVQHRDRGKVVRKRKRFQCSPELEGVMCELEYELRKRSSGNKYQREKHELLRRLSSVVGCTVNALTYQLKKSCEKAARNSIRSTVTSEVNPL